MAGPVLRLPFVFIPHGAEAPAWWRAAHPDAIRLPARLVLRRGVQQVQLLRQLPGSMRVLPPGNAGRRRAPLPDLGRWLQERFGLLFPSERFDEQRSKPPPGSRSIKKTPWSGNHEKIKKAIGAEPDDNVSIAPDGTVRGENPDGSWTNHGPAENFIEGSKPEGRRGKNRDDRRRRE